MLLINLGPRRGQCPKPKFPKAPNFIIVRVFKLILSIFTKLFGFELEYMRNPEPSYHVCGLPNLEIPSSPNLNVYYTFRFMVVA